MSDQYDVVIKGIEDKIVNLEEKINSFKTDIDRNLGNIYKQLEELRESVQDLYGEILASDREYHSKMMGLSNRIDDLSKTIQSLSVKPEPITIEKKGMFEDMKILDIIKIIAYLIVGLLVVLGGLYMALSPLLAKFFTVGLIGAIGAIK